MNEWISVEDALPKPDVPVLVCDVPTSEYAPCMFVAAYNESTQIDGKVEKTWHEVAEYNVLFTVTHWQTLPPPPTK
jgi:hypothetical protein